MKIFNFAFVINLALFVGCCTPKEIIREVPVEIIKDHYHNVYIHDTTHTTDSTIIYQKGDTVFKEKYKYIYTEKQIHDTLATHDTIDRPVYITKEKIVNKPQWWPIWLFSGTLLLILIGYIIISNKTNIFKKWKLMQQK